MTKRVLAICILLCSAAFAQLHEPKVIMAASSPSVSMTCTAPTTGSPATSFNFYRVAQACGTGLTFSLAGSNTSCSYLDSTVALGTTYCYVVTSVNAAGESGYSNQAQAIVPGVPNPPTGLTITGVVAKNNVPLEWKAPAPQSQYQVVSYAIMRGRTSSSLAWIAKVPVPTVTYTDTKCNGTCFYGIEAYDLTGKTHVYSGLSNIVSVTN